MGRLTNRDKEVYNYMIQTRLPIQAIDMAKMFYLSDTRNIGSATTIQIMTFTIKHFCNCNGTANTVIIT